MTLPNFTYHPDPIATGAFEKSDEPCQCCEKARGYLYASTIYCTEDITQICPWCIADGSAAEKFECTFNDDRPLIQAGIPFETVREICQKTPGYPSWQQDAWQHHCGDACEFHGDAEKTELQRLSGADLSQFLKTEMIDPNNWKQILKDYEKGGNPAIYKFKCRHCPAIVFTLDFS